MALETTDAGLEEFNSYMRGEFAYERLSPEGKAQVDAYLDDYWKNIDALCANGG